MTATTFPRPFALIYDALPGYPEEQVEQAIHAALQGKKRSLMIDQMIDAVEQLLLVQRNADMQAMLAQAQETARMMQSMREYRAQAEAERQKRLADEAELLRRFRVRLWKFIAARQQECAASMPKAA